MNWPTASVSMTAGYSERENCESSKKAGHVGNELLRQVIKHGQAVPASSSTGGSPQGLWPTPEASQGGRQGGSFNQTSWKNADGTPRQPSLAQAAIKEQWPTPRAACPGSRPNGNGGKVLEEEARKNWATPIMGDSHLASTPEVAQKRIEEGKVTLSRQNPGKLNPRWVETLMGLPVGWTMPSCTRPLIIAPTSCVFLGTESSPKPQP